MFLSRGLAASCPFGGFVELRHDSVNEVRDLGRFSVKRLAAMSLYVRTVFLSGTSCNLGDMKARGIEKGVGQTSTS